MPLGNGKPCHPQHTRTANTAFRTCTTNAPAARKHPSECKNIHPAPPACISMHPCRPVRVPVRPHPAAAHRSALRRRGFAKSTASPPRFHKNPVHRPVFLRKGVKSMVNLFKAVRLALQTLCKTRKLSSWHKIALTKYNYTGILIHSSIKQGTAYFFNAAALCPAGAPPR